MFARVTKFKCKPDSLADAKAHLNAVRDRILGLAGLHQFLNVVDADGHGYTISVWDSEASATANAGHVAEIWSGLAPHMDGPLQPGSYNVAVNLTNPV